VDIKEGYARVGFQDFHDKAPPIWWAWWAHGRLAVQRRGARLAAASKTFDVAAPAKKKKARRKKKQY
jgi:hypothetical protein